MSLAQNGNQDRMHPCVCTGRVEETPDVFTLFFKRSDGGRFTFLAGQFVTISFAWKDQKFSRVFTIASPPTRSESIALTIKATPDGKATRILQQFEEGCVAEISEASGKFTLHGRPVEKLLFLGAGSGITPFMSMIRCLYDARTAQDIRFIQCARTPNDILFEHELETLRTGMPGLRVHMACSRASDGGDVRHIGRLDGPKLLQIVPDVAERTALLCGPASFMDAIRSDLLKMGVSAERILEEAFAPRVGGTHDIAAGEKAVIVFERSGVKFEADRNATILASAEAAGIYIETACQMGVCGTCKLKLNEGAVDMDDMGGLSDIDREAGYILACCSRPQGRIAVDL